LSPEPWTNSEK